MWQNAIITLARNPAALRALIDLIGPAIRQETGPAVVSLRQEVQAVVTRQAEAEAQLRADLAQTRADLTLAAQRQAELGQELAETKAQLAMVLRAIQDMPSGAQIVVERGGRPWWRR